LLFALPFLSFSCLSDFKSAVFQIYVPFEFENEKRMKLAQIALNQAQEAQEAALKAQMADKNAPPVIKGKGTTRAKAPRTSLADEETEEEMVTDEGLFDCVCILRISCFDSVCTAQTSGVCCARLRK
jgi:hypothetical protein